MWERRELKEKAKKVVHKNYWTAIVVCFIIALFTGEFGTSIVGVWQSEDSMDPNYVVHRHQERLEQDGYELDTFFSQTNIEDTLNETQKKVWEAIEDNLNSATKSQKYIFKIWDAITLFSFQQDKVGVVLCVTAVLALAFTIFVADPLIVGGKRYFLKAREGSNTRVGILGEVFQKEHWLNVAIIMFLRNLYNALWYLTIVGGVIKTYEYRMIPYILAENPKIKRKEVFELSKKMMKGNKWKTFVLDISFFGWNFLSVLTLGLLSILYVNPYNASTIAELYVTLRDKSNEQH
ncbi:MAG: DUF975 family protein [Clostridia bacterium]|nr:DUF975 family protein [Clostridia bacterium]